MSYFRPIDRDGYDPETMQSGDDIVSDWIDKDLKSTGGPYRKTGRPDGMDGGLAQPLGSGTLTTHYTDPKVQAAGGHRSPLAASDPSTEPYGQTQRGYVYGMPASAPQPGYGPTGPQVMRKVSSISQPNTGAKNAKVVAPPAEDPTGGDVR